jgi:uncharacterized membrane protein
MDVLSLATVVFIRHTTTYWTDIIMFGLLSGGGIYLADRARRVLYQAGLDCIALYAAWQQARIDTELRKFEISQARLQLETQRHRLLESIQ